jgi:hypothetical protein
MVDINNAAGDEMAVLPRAPVDEVGIADRHGGHLLRPFAKENQTVLFWEWKRLEEHPVDAEDGGVSPDA